MIYIATIHWKSARWIDIQKKYLDKHISEEYKIFAFLEDIDDQFESRFYFSINQPFRDHGLKLNILADVIKQESTNEDDILIFLDGDAFPINNLNNYIRKKLNNYPLIAMKRSENLGDVIAHPAFCATTIGFWKKIGGSWQKGFPYKNNLGHIVADVGGHLYNNLTKTRTDWYPLLRSNKHNLHPLFFGIYDNTVYHHGAGFRDPVSSVDLYEENYFSRVNQLLQSLYIRLSSSLNDKNKAKFSPFKWKRRKIKKRNLMIEYDVFSKIQNDEFFYTIFM